MIHVPVSEAKKSLSEIIARAEAGEEVVITPRGKPAVSLVAAKPIQAASQRDRVVAAFRQLSALRHKISMQGDLMTVAREGLD